MVQRITYRRRLNRFVRSMVSFHRAQLFRSQGMARQTRATSRSSGGKEAKAAPRPPIRWVLLGAYQFLWESVLSNWLGWCKISSPFIWYAIWTYVFLRSTGGEDELSAVSSNSKKIKKPQTFAPDGLLQMRAQLSRFNHYRFSCNSISHRMEARIEAVEEELRQEKQKNASRNAPKI